MGFIALWNGLQNTEIMKEESKFFSKYSITIFYAYKISDESIISAYDR